MKDYFVDRSQDFGDIINIGIEKDVYGFSFYFLGAPIGIQKASSGKGVGLKFGHLGYYETGDDEDVRIYPSEDKYPIYDKGYKFGDISIFEIFPEWNSYYHKPAGNVKLRNWKKRFLSFSTARCAKYTVAYKWEESSSCGKFNSYYLGMQTELSIGIYLGFRVGFNVNEFFDFISGVFGFDPLSDDMGRYPNLKVAANAPDWQMDNFFDDRINFHEEKELEKRRGVVEIK